MKTGDNGKHDVMPEKTTANTQTIMIVGGCKVTLNFPIKSESKAISEVKRMMLGGAVKT